MKSKTKRVLMNIKRRRSLIELRYWLPILFAQIFLTLTLVVYQFGPWNYSTRGDVRVIFLSLLYQFSLLMGFALANFLYSKPSSKSVSWGKILTVSLLVSLISLIPTTFARTGKIFPDLIQGLNNPGIAYSMSLDASRNGISVLIEYIRILLGFLLYAYLPLSIFFWRTISLFHKIGAVIMIIFTSMLYISMGTNKSIGEFAILIPIIGFISVMSNHNYKKTRHYLLIIGTGIILLMGFLSFFTETQISRSGSGVKAGYFPPGNTRADLSHPSITVFPEKFRPGALGLANYVTQGYFALGLALDTPFTSMYGLGSSTFISRQITKLIGSSQFEDFSYPAKIEIYGWDRYIYWSSIYLWIASDISLLGVPFFCFIVGFLLLYSWRDTLDYRSPPAVIMLSLNIIMLSYFSSNNQIGQSGEMLVAYFTTMLIWLMHRSKVKFKIIGGIKL